jgi:GT2 family glycosyltransferase
MKALDLSILIVTYNSARLIGALLDRLTLDMKSLSAEVIIVDNASQDGTAEFVKLQYPWVTLVASKENLGFAAGNNLAAKSAIGRYLLLLNPDAIPDAGALKQALDMLDQHADVGLAGGELRGIDGQRQPSARMFPKLRDEFFTLSGLAARYPKSPFFARIDRHWADAEKAAVVDWIPGAFVFIPTQVFAKLGGFDERFFMYYEEVDLCQRMQQAGLKVYFWPTLKAMHIGGESAKTVKSARISKSGSQLESWRMRSGLLYYRKHHGAMGAAGLHWLEWSWHKLRQVKAVLSGKTEKANDFAVHCHQLGQAWNDTKFGQVSPIRPW